MKQVLLAIDGDIPTRRIFQYTVDLCRSLQAELSILQFIRNRQLSQCLSRTRKRVERLGKYLEDSFAGIAFAEHGALGIADEFLPGASAPLKELIRSSTNPLPVRLALGHGKPETGIADYLENHQEIVLMVFDPSQDKRTPPEPRKRTIARIRKQVWVPMVVLKP